MGVAQMRDSNRRTVIGAIAVALALPLLGTPPAVRARAARIAFPTRPIRLTRELRRDLGGNDRLTVVRSWDCSFESHGEGARVSARQVDVEVSAPLALARMAEIERDRAVTGLFPMELDRSGLITGWPDDRAQGIEPAVTRALQSLASLDLSEDDAADARRYLSAIGRTAAAIVSQVPRDLFFPETGRSSENRAVTLPDGTPGSYEVTIEARVDPVSGFLRSSERRIVTRIDTSERTASERWSIDG